MNPIQVNDPEIQRLMHPRRIVVATDLNDRERLIPHAIAQANASGASIVLVHAIPPEIPPFTEGGGGFYAPDPKDDHYDADILAETARKIEAGGVHCETVLRHGFPVNVITDVIEERNAGRVIMGSHGRGRLGELIFGSVASQLLGVARVPVFIVGPRCVDCPDQTLPRRILHPTSMTGEYLRSLGIVVELAKIYGAEVIMLHIADQAPQMFANADSALCWMERMIAESGFEKAQPGPKIKLSVAFGEKAVEIQREASRVMADWIVMGIEEGGRFWPATESTAYRTFAVVNCPVFVLCQPRSIAKKQADHEVSETAMA